MAPVSASPFFDRAPLVVALILQAYLFFHVPEDTPLAEGGCMFDKPCMPSWLSWLTSRRAALRRGISSEVSPRRGELVIAGADPERHTVSVTSMLDLALYASSLLSRPKPMHSLRWPSVVPRPHAPPLHPPAPTSPLDLPMRRQTPPFAAIPNSCNARGPGRGHKCEGDECGESPTTRQAHGMSRGSGEPPTRCAQKQFSEIVHGLGTGQATPCVARAFHS